MALSMLITGGPTREPIDAVRFISNRSSGKTALAVAQAAMEAGHDVTMLLGCGTIDPPTDLRVHRFDSGDDLKRLLDTHFESCDVLIMAAAVADFQPACVADGKIPRDPTKQISLHLQPTSDLVAIMASRRRHHQRVIAFALEEPQLLAQRAAEKLRRKDVDAIIANPLNTVDADTIKPLWLTTKGHRDSAEAMPKPDFARWLLARIEALY